MIPPARIVKGEPMVRSFVVPTPSASLRAGSCAKNAQGWGTLKERLWFPPFRKVRERMGHPKETFCGSLFSEIVQTFAAPNRIWHSLPARNYFCAVLIIGGSILDSDLSY
jgi:hypothetical protein